MGNTGSAKHVLAKLRSVLIARLQLPQDPDEKGRKKHLGIKAVCDFQSSGETAAAGETSRKGNVTVCFLEKAKSKQKEKEWKLSVQLLDGE